MKLDASTFKKAIDIKCWKIKLLNIRHRRIVKKYLAVLLDYHNNKKWLRL